MTTPDRPHPPLIGITPDVSEPKPGTLRIQCSCNYSRAVARAGGLPVFLAPIVEQIPHQLSAFDGFLLTGGDDPRTEEFGEPSHPKITPMHAERQRYEVALARALLADPTIPVLGVCLGMQILSLAAGGRLHQHLPETHADADRHHGDRSHGVVPAPGSWLLPGAVTSHHRQAVADPGNLIIDARSEDGLIEAVRHPSAAFCLGVQWHPERTSDLQLGEVIFERFVTASAARAAKRAR